MNNKVIWLNKERSCGECAKCCEGWLKGEAHGHSFYNGKPCFFLEKTCTIYDHRPEDPCKTYSCAWLSEPDVFPEWFKPSLSNVIITKKKQDNIDYYQVIETGKKIDSSILNWLIIYTLNSRKNMLYHVNGEFSKIGGPEFLSMEIR